MTKYNNNITVKYIQWARFHRQSRFLTWSTNRLDRLPANYEIEKHQAYIGFKDFYWQLIMNNIFFKFMYSNVFAKESIFICFQHRMNRIPIRSRLISEITQCYHGFKFKPWQLIITHILYLKETKWHILQYKAKLN